MKNEKKKPIMFFLVLFLSIGFFGFGENISASCNSLVITEIMYALDGSDSGNEWIEIFNNSDEKFILEKGGVYIKDTWLKNNTSKHHIFYQDEVASIEPRDFFILTNNSDLESFRRKYEIGHDVNIFRSAFSSLNDSSGSISISCDNGETFFGQVDYLRSWGAYENEKTLEKIDFSSNNEKSNWQESYFIGGTPGEKSSEKSEPKIYSNKIIINEILPNPKGVDKGAEFIEFYNGSDKGENLEGWKWKDRKGAIREFKRITDDPGELLIESLDFLVLDPQKYKMTLYNKDDFIELLTPDGKPASSVSYLGSAKENLSYGFDGSQWRWSKHLTPGAENVFDDAPNFKVIKDDKVYKNFLANFDVNIKKYKKSKYKITWDFGDGHKSYKKTTTHKYKKKGKYAASVKIFNGSEEVVKTFKVEVKDYPKYDVEIIAINPNPEGRDADLETLTVKNNSKKKVNLQNWSIATGDKKLTNHPIALKTVLKPKETLTITRQMSKFTLNNQKANVELRYPTGKVASKMKYDKKAGNIEEGEILEKSKLGWIWKNTAPVANVPQALDVSQENNLLAIAPEIGENLETPQILGESDVQADVPPVEQLVGEKMLEGGQSEMKNKKDFKIVLAGFVYSSPTEQFSENINQTRIEPTFDFTSLFL